MSQVHVYRNEAGVAACSRCGGTGEEYPLQVVASDDGTRFQICAHCRTHVGQKELNSMGLHAALEDE